MPRSIGSGGRKAPCHFLIARSRPQRHLDDGRSRICGARAVASGEPLAIRTSSTCAECRSRYATFTGWLDRIHDDALPKPTTHSRQSGWPAQQAQVMRRLEALERPARVIVFPRFARPGHVDPGDTRSAGLRLLPQQASSSGWPQVSSSTCDTSSRPSSRSPAAERAALPRRRRRTRQCVPASASTSAVVGRDAVLRRRSGARSGTLTMLQAIDDITPRARDHRPATVARWPRRPAPSPSSSAKAST